MTIQHVLAAAITLALSFGSWHSSFAQQQSDARNTAGAAPADSQAAERRQILESDRWRQMHRKFYEWVSVQQAYTDEQLAAVRAELSGRIASMSPRELETFLKDMEDRLAVLTSPEAEDARLWLAQFLAVAKNPEAQLGRSRPDVLNMTAGQIRQELLWLQQHRAARQQSQAAFQQGRTLQKQAALGVHDARSQGQNQVAESRARAASAQFRSEYSPSADGRPPFSDLRLDTLGRPIYSVSPWGTPIYWHPMRGQW